jgi:hypothetical protein
MAHRQLPGNLGGNMRIALCASVILLAGGLARGGDNETIQQAGSQAATAISDVQRKHGEGFHATGRNSIESAASQLDSVISMYQQNYSDHKSFIKQIGDDMVAAHARAMSGVRALESAGSGPRQTVAAAFGKKMVTLVEARREDLRKDYEGAIEGFRGKAIEFRQAVLQGDLAQSGTQKLESTNFRSELQGGVDKATRYFGIESYRLPVDVQEKLRNSIRQSAVDPLQRTIDEEKNEFYMDIQAIQRSRDIFSKAPREY